MKVSKTLEEWKKILSPEAFYVCRQNGTEAPFTGAYNENKKDGIYRCVCCDSILFTSDTKFNSGTGWPSFFEAVEGSMKEVRDISHGMIRTEVRCASCDAHLGHLFPDGPEPTGLRYCINSVCLNFEEESH